VEKGREVSRLGTGRLTIMGEHMLAVMNARGISSWTGLAERIWRKTGVRYKPARISNWAYGRHPINLEFARAFVMALDLNAEERAEWHEAFLFGHDAYADSTLPDREAAS
jgi:hypothetical protein